VGKGKKKEKKEKKKQLSHCHSSVAMLQLKRKTKYLMCRRNSMDTTHMLVHAIYGLDSFDI
jgi:hypothetical protein